MVFNRQIGCTVLELLKHRTDEKRRMKQVETVAYLKEAAGAAHARKSICKDLTVLQIAGYPIRCDHGWFYKHEFCSAELNLLIDTLRKRSYDGST